LKNKSWVAASAATVLAFPVVAQQVPVRPDAGTILQQERIAPQVPAPGGAPVVTVPQPPAAARYDQSIRVTPTGFAIRGNSVFPESVLQPLLNEFVNKSTDMEGLVKAAQAVRKYYRDRGYLLTEAYLPEQQFSARGGVVTIQVLEARVGKIGVKVEDKDVSETLARRIVLANLRPGDAITEYSLDKPILLLRDLIGYEATASVEPGGRAGEADITVLVKSAGPKVDGTMSVDNYGARAAGQIRFVLAANANNLTGKGDQLQFRAQLTDQTGSDLYRVGYSTNVGSGTKLGLSRTQAEYRLGKQFSALGASGKATILGLNLTQPIIRSRPPNLLASLTVEHKSLQDTLTVPPSVQDKNINSVRLSILGNFVDEFYRPSFNSYSLNLTGGNLKMDPTALGIDQGAVGLRTAGSFAKINGDYLRTTFLSPSTRLLLGIQGQKANKNLTSAEKFGLGGPFAVRGYPIGEGVGDSGVIATGEYRYQFGEPVMSLPLSVGAFYDIGWIKYNERGAPFAVAKPTETLQSWGLGLNAGEYGNYLLSTMLAWRITRAPVSDPDNKPRLWMTFTVWL
jgi:hemolysin activation/secretion protein